MTAQSLGTRGVNMIKKTGAGFKVTSEEGKSLSKENLSKDQAEKRLRQIEWFKSHKVSKETSKSTKGK